MREIVHRNEESTTLNEEGEYRVKVEHDAFENPSLITFKVAIESEDAGTLKAIEFQSDSFDSGMKAVKAYEEHALDPSNEIGLMALEVGKLWGFEVDFSKGIEFFLSDMYKQHDTKQLRHELEQLPVKKSLVRNAIEKELKLRGEI